MFLNRKGNWMKRSAFTLLELVMVIVVLGILAAVSLPKLDRDIKQEAADSILSDIRYTQHLALMDNKHDFDNPKWHQRFWRMVFSTCTGTDKYYMIGTDDNTESATNAFFDETEAAIDPANGKPMFWTNGSACQSGGDGTVSERIFISKQYGIKAVTPSGGCPKAHIGFDHLGRPHKGFSTSIQPNYSSIMTTDCQFTFTLSDDTNFSITIEKETGYAYISDQPES